MVDHSAFVREFVPWSQNLLLNQYPSWGSVPDPKQTWDIDDPYNPDPYK